MFLWKQEIDSNFDNLKELKTIGFMWLTNATEDSIENIGFGRKIVFGNKKKSYHADLMNGIFVNIRNGSGEFVKKSKNVLIAMLEELVSKKDVAEKKRI